MADTNAPTLGYLTESDLRQSFLVGSADLYRIEPVKAIRNLRLGQDTSPIIVPPSLTIGVGRKLGFESAPIPGAFVLE